MSSSKCIGLEFRGEVWRLIFAGSLYRGGNWIFGFGCNYLGREDVGEGVLGRFGFLFEGF